MRKDVLTKEEQFLLQEYNIRSNQMIHEDKLRNQLITFIITLSTTVIGGLAYLSQFYYYSQLNTIIIIFNLLLIIIIIFSIIIIAKIRRAQLEEDNICSNIRAYFFKHNYNYYIINILLKSKFPTEPDCCKPSQTLWFVCLLSFFNSCLILNLLLLTMKRSFIINIVGYHFFIAAFFIAAIAIFIFWCHIGLYKIHVQYEFKPYLI